MNEPLQTGSAPFDTYVRRLLTERTYRSAALPRPWRWQPALALKAVRFHARLLGVYAHTGRVVARGGLDRMAYTRAAWDILRLIEAEGAPVEATGFEHVAGLGGPAVIVGNHMSSIETLVLPALLVPFREVAFVVKTSLTRYPLFGPIVNAVPMITVGRVNAREDLQAVFEQGQRLLERGVSVVIFPQATRDAVFDPSKFNTLGVKLAARAGVPVIPLALKTDFLGNGGLVKDFGPIDPARPVRFRFGAPFPAQGNGRAAHEAVVEFVRTNLREWGGRMVA